MQFLPLALSWEWVASNAAAVAAGSTMVSLLIIYLYRTEIVTALQRRKIGVRLGLIEPFEQDSLIRRENLETLLDRLERIFKRTKTRSERLPRLEAFGIDPEKALKGREKKFSLILDQIRRIAIHVTNLEDVNEILEIRTMLDRAVNDLGTLTVSDEMAVDNQDAITKLNAMVNDIDEAIAEIERTEEEAMGEKEIPTEWLLQEERADETEAPPPHRAPIEELLVPVDEEEEDEEEDPPQRQAMLA